MRTLRTDIDINGNETDVWYVPTGATTIWHRTLNDGVVVSDVDTGDPAPDPEPDPATPDDALLIAAEQARRDAYDAVIAAGTLTMARINAANRAGMDAYIAVLGG